MKRELVKTNTKMIYARSGERVIALKGDIDNAKGGHKFKTLIECYKWICYLDISCVEQIIMLKMTGWYSGSVHYPFHYWRPLLITARFRNMHTGSWSYCSACKRKKMNSFESECWLFCYSNCHPIWSKHLLLEFRLKPSIYKKKNQKENRWKLVNAYWYGIPSVHSLGLVWICLNKEYDWQRYKVWS